MDLKLTGVSCTSSSACTAVGHYWTSSSGQEALVLRWDGTSWTLQSTPTPDGATGVELADVSCYSASGCVAVGTYSTETGSPALALRWDGSEWAIEPTPEVGSNTVDYLESVSCTWNGECVAVGNIVFGGGHTELLALESGD
jgi:hypothetical protein